MTKTTGIIDRFEGEFAVIEYGGRKHFNLPKGFLPRNAKEGDSINFQLTVDENETANRRKSIEALAKKLFRD